MISLVWLWVTLAMGADTVVSRFPKNPHDSRLVFSRLFPTLQSFMPQTDASRDQVANLGARGGLMDPTDVPGVTNPLNPDNPVIAAGFTFLGQFLDHDMTFDKRSKLKALADPSKTINFRKPFLDLDSIYGKGPFLI